MKSRTPFFNTSLLRKDVVRFAPAWVLYAVFLVLIFTGTALSHNKASMATVLSSSIPAFSFVNLFYAMICAQLLFGDLFQSRLCNALHALPIRRESWFATHLVAGLLFSAVPVAAAGIIFLTMLGSFWMAALLWMLALMLEFLFFFSVAILSVMLVGNRFAAVVVYTILNFLSGIVFWLFYALYQPHLYGFVLNEAPLMKLCPAVWLTTFDWFAYNGVTALLRIGEGWGYLAICAGVAVAFLGLSLVLYRKRALEKAGDFIVFKPTAPVFLVLYTFSAGAALHLFSELFIGDEVEFVFLVIGLAIGFFTGLMLLERTVRVFRLKTLGRFGILLAVFGLSLLLTVWDPIGLTRWVPKPQDIRWVSLDYYSNADLETHAITDEETIRQILSIHRHGVEHPEEGNNGKADISMHLSYKLKSGQLVQRQYYIDTDTLAAMTLQTVLSRPEVIFGTDFATAEALGQALYMAEIDYSEKYGYTSEQGYESLVVGDRNQLEGLAEALIADAMAGNLCQHWEFTSNDTERAYIYLRTRKYHADGSYYSDYSWSVTCTSKATNTLAWLEACE